MLPQHIHEPPPLVLLDGLAPLEGPRLVFGVPDTELIREPTREPTREFDIGIRDGVGQLLVTDWLSRPPNWGESCRHVFVFCLWQL